MNEEVIDKIVKTILRTPEKGAKEGNDLEKNPQNGRSKIKTTL